MSSLYDNLLKATNNVNDITHEKYAIVTYIDNKLCNVKELDNDLEHLNVSILNNLELKIGDKVVLGFIDNNIYNPIILGVIGRDVIQEMEIDLSNVTVDFNYSYGLSGIEDEITIDAFLKIINNGD